MTGTPAGEWVVRSKRDEAPATRVRLVLLVARLLRCPPAQVMAASPATAEMVHPPEPTAVGAVRDGDWRGLARGCVELFDELDRAAGTGADEAAEAEHVMLRLTEILERSGVEVIDGDDAFDGRRHRMVGGTPGAAPRAALVETVRPGFAIGARVLRQARVRVSTAADER